MKRNEKEEKRMGKETIYIVCIIALLSAIMVMPAAATTVDIVADADTHVRDNGPGENYGNEEYMVVEYFDAPDMGNRRGLTHFDLSSIPADATIDAATVHLYVCGGGDCRFDFGNPTYNIHRIEESWGEMTVTWNNQPGYNPTPIDSITKPTCEDCWDVYNVASDVQDFVDGTSNYGWLVKLETESDPDEPGTYYETRGCSESSHWPYLEVTYTEAPEIGCVAEDGTVYKCGETVLQSCTLNGNMTCPAGSHGLIVGADDIVIDGYNETDDKYYWIDGGSPISHAWSGVYDPLHDNIVIKNLEVKQFRNGIYLKGDVDEDDRVENVTIENCTIHDIGTGTGTGAGTQGIKLKAVCDSTIKGCEIYNVDGTGSGCEAGGDGIFLIGSPGAHGYGRNNTFTDNNIHNNRKGGIFIKGAPDRNTISYNHLWENGELYAGEVGGIILRCKNSYNNTITHNNASDNTGSGIYLGGGKNSVTQNNVTGNKNYVLRK
jgi:parallel beta-helix repeat protein